MNSFGGWFRQFTAKLTYGLRRFMEGRYGTDRLNMLILCTGLAASILSSLLKVSGLNVIFWLLSYGLMFWAIWRSLSRNT